MLYNNNVSSLIISIILIVSMTLIVTSKQECTIDINDKNHLLKSTPYPLFLNSDYDFVRTTKIHNNTNRRKIVLQENQKLYLACPGNKNYLKIFGPHKSETNASCISGQIYRIDDIDYHIKDLSCNRWPFHIQKRTGICLDDKSLLEIGFQLKNNHFISFIKICHDEIMSKTLYTEFIMRPDAVDFQRDVARPRYWNNQFMLKNAHKKYSNQENTLGKLLGAINGSKYFSKSEGRVFSRGHLAAKADFLYAPQQLATFYLTNTAPQWTSFNNGSWLSLETDVRKFVEKSNRDFIIYTGTHGNLSLPNDTDELVELHLHNGTKTMPVPEYFWKIIRDPFADLAIAIVGINNIYLNESESQIYQERICQQNICEQVEFLRRKKFKNHQGFLFCCDVSQFRNSIDGFPEFSVSGNLLS